MPTVDIIVVTHNYGRFLADAITSALTQDYPRLRVTVVDDGSTDDSRAVAKTFSERVQLIFKENGGQASALNAGWQAVDGDVVCFLDADDMLCRSVIREAIETMRIHPAAAKVVFRTSVVDEGGRPLGRLEPPGHLPMSHGDLRHAVLAHPFDLVWPPLSGQVFRAEAIAQLFPVGAVPDAG